MDLLRFTLNISEMHMMGGRVMSELTLANGISLLETEVFLASFELFVLTFCYGTVNKRPFYEMEVSKLIALLLQRALEISAIHEEIFMRCIAL